MNDGRVVEKREEQAEQRERATEQDPHLVVAGPEVADVRGLEVADFPTAVALRVARRRVVVGVLPSVVEQEQQAERGEDGGGNDEKHACGRERLNRFGQFNK
jgi:hypothetical protein